MATNFEKEIDWRNLNVRRDREFEPLVEQLVHRHPAIFSHIKDLMIFAAMVGFNKEHREPITKDTIPITLHTYSTDQQDGIIYMIALIHSKDGNCLRDEKLQESIKIFEEYCRAGLLTIQSWLNQRASEEPVVVLLDKIYKQYAKADDSAGEETEEIPLPDILS